MECAAVASAGKCFYYFNRLFVRDVAIIIICYFRQSEELIGLMKTRVPCLFPECSTEYTLNDLKVEFPFKLCVADRNYLYFLYLTGST